MRALVVILLAGCLRPSPREVNAQNCANSIHAFETQHCTNIIPQPDRDQQIAFQARQLQTVCYDPASQERLRELDRTCFAAYRASTSERDREDIAIRERYKEKVSVLHTDREYVAARDAYRVARDEAAIAAREFEERGHPIRSPYERKYERTRKDVDSALERLHAVIVRHGIEPKHGTVLGLW